MYDNGTWAVPPGAGGGEANTASNQGGEVGVYKQKTGVDLEFNTFDSDDFELTGDIISLKAGGAFARSIVEGRLEANSDTELIWDGYAVGVWNGSNWILATAGDVSFANTDNDLDSTPLAVDTVYAIFAEWQSDDTFDLVADIWSAPATDYAALYEHQGVLVQENTADGLKRRFLGAVYMYNDSSTPKFKDEETLLYVWNQYDRVEKVLRSYNNTGGGWSYSTNTWRELNGGSNHVRGHILIVEPVDVLCQFGMVITDSSNRADFGVCLDATNTVENGYAVVEVGANNNTGFGTAKLALTTGEHYLTMTEKASDAASYSAWGSSASTNAYATVRM